MKEEIIFLKKQSANAYTLSKKAFIDGDYNWSLFLLEQAIQLLLKYFLALKVGYFTKTHKLSKLFEEATLISNSFGEFYEKNRDKLEIIEESYLLARYLGKEYKRKDVENKFEIYESLKELVEKHESN